MKFDLNPPIFIIPEFLKGHRDFAKQMGLKFFPEPAHKIPTRNGSCIDAFLTEVPKEWSQRVDTNCSAGEQNGAYIVDEKGRRRIRFGDGNAWNHPQAESLPRFAVQEWWLGGGEWLWYVRKTMGDEDSIFRYCYLYRDEKDEKRVPFRAPICGLTDDSGVKACREWLNKKYPLWESPLAYWDDD